MLCVSIQTSENFSKFVQLYTYVQTSWTLTYIKMVIEKVKVKREINVKVKVAAKKDLPILRQSPQQSALMRGDNRGY